MMVKVKGQMSVLVLMVLLKASSSAVTVPSVTEVGVGLRLESSVIDPQRAALSQRQHLETLFSR